MKIKSILFHNFKPFKGKQLLNFEKETNDEKQQNIVLIGGLNGAGKTTTIEALKLCLYGKNFDSEINTKKKYNDFLKSAFNNAAKKDKHNSMSLQVDVVLNEDYPPYSLSIQRSWKIHENKIEENLQLIKDGNPFQFIEEEYWQEFIAYKIPKPVSEFFIFNGEKVKELTTGEESDELLKSTIKDLIGLTHYENLKTDLESLRKKIIRRNNRKKDLQQKLTQLEEIEADLQKKSSNISDEIKETKNELSKNESAIKQKNKEIKRKAGKYAKDKEKIDGQIYQIQGEISSLREQIDNYSKNYLPFLICNKTLDKMINSFTKEKQYKDQSLIADQWEEKKGKIMKNILKIESLEQISKSKKQKLIEEISEKLTSEFSKEKTSINLLHNLTRSDYEKILLKVEKTQQSTKNQLIKTLKERETKTLQIDDLKKTMRDIPLDDFLMEQLESIRQFEVQRSQLENKISKLKDESEKIDQQLIEIGKKIEKQEAEVVCKKEDEKKIDMIQHIIASIDDYTHKLVEINSENLQETITTMYQTLSNKEDMVERILIHPETFTSSLLDYDGHPLEKKQISAGEKEIYALSILWGLSQVSHTSLPMIIDTPLSKLDSKHVENITTQFLPNATDQVILLSQDREIDEKLHTLLKPYILQSYTIKHGNEDKIQEGYFKFKEEG